MPIECRIDTKGSAVVSQSRPIRSRADKLEFQELVNDLERRGIVKPSVSVWLNPVVLVRKKTGALRFCIDFRKLNDLVDLEFQEIE